jgi:hypothetical protein
MSAVVRTCPELVYSVFQCEKGYRICATWVRPYKMGEWQDCEVLFGSSNLWITYSTEEEALTAARSTGRVITTNA